MTVKDLQQHDVTANDIRVHYAARGTGPLVLLCHGFPEGWYSWRDQLQALAAAGYRAVAPDMRGYGRTDAPPETRRLTLQPGKGWLANTLDPVILPAWLTDADLDHMAAEFSRSGFRGGLNWYRNLDRNWELTAPWAGALIHQPALFIAGSEDPIIALGSGAAALQALPAMVPGLRRKLIIDGAGHFIQQERPQLVNEAIIEFLGGLPAWGR